MVAVVCTSQAQPAAEDQNKRIEVHRIDADIAVDGVLDEAAWADAVVITDLHQLNPVEFAPPSQRTEIRLFFDENALYVAARLWDDDVENITARVLRQGEGLRDEDRFAVIIDPYLNRRSGYRFQVNPHGVRWEGLYQDTSDIESNWDGIWEGSATRDAEGWTAEMAIPFKTLSFNPNTTDWGINFERRIQRDGESIGWVSRNRQINPGVAGTASGFEGLRQGRGLDIVPSVSVTEARTFGELTNTESNLEPSLDVFYKVTPQLNAALTINTDFSATEVDDRQVDLTRFGVFFPEKRDFFLQDADIFEFGRIGANGFNQRGGNGNPAVPNASRENGRPFFSRTIGLSATGQPVDIDYGGKLSGRVGRWNVGALTIRQDEYEYVDPLDQRIRVAADDIFVGRVAANVLQESTAGIIITDGDPHSNLDSSMYGADFRYRNSRLPGGRVVEGAAWLQKSDNESVDGDDGAWGFLLSAPNNTGWRGTLNVREIEENFDPAVGFVNQAGIRDYALDFGYRHRFADSYWRSTYAGFAGYRIDRLDTNALDTEIVSAHWSFETHTQDEIFIRGHSTREVLIEDFQIYRSSDGSQTVVVPPGDYTYDGFNMGVRTGSQRRFAIFTTFAGGDFYNGRRSTMNADFTWRPSEKFRLGVGYRVNDIELPEGDFTVRLSSLQAQYVFSNTLSWVNLIQYDNVSETVGINSRLHWIPQAGREGFIVINHGLQDFDRNDSFHSTNADFTIKFSYTWRY
jgi:hypothetical protein